MKYIIPCTAALLLSACGNPSGISDAEYAKYKELGAPKILFSCTTQNYKSVEVLTEIKNKALAKADACRSTEETEEAKVACMKKYFGPAILSMEEKLPIIEIGYQAGIGVAATYNKILQDAKNRCTGKFSIIEKSE